MLTAANFTQSAPWYLTVWFTVPLTIVIVGLIVLAIRRHRARRASSSTT